MGTTAEKLQKVLDSKNAIKNAINNKGGNVGEKMSEYALAIENIQTGIDTSDGTASAENMLAGTVAYAKDKRVVGSIETYDYEGESGSTNTLKKLLDTTKSAYHLFYGYQGTSLDELISYNDTENVENLQFTFYGCSNLLKLPPINSKNATSTYTMARDCKNIKTTSVFDLSNCTNSSYMFYGCYELKEAYLENTNQIKNMSNMFYQDSKLEYVSPLNTDSVTDINRIFYNCNKLKKVDFTSWDKLTSSSATNMMFIDCKVLTKVIIRKMTVIPVLNETAFTRAYHFTGEKDATYNPDGLKDGRIYVPDNMVDQLKQATNWSAYADIIVPLSTLQEE